MASPIGGMKNVKIFVLYLMANIGYPMNFATINDVTKYLTLHCPGSRAVTIAAIGIIYPI